MVLMCAIAWMQYCEADKWVRLKLPNKHTEELVWYGIEEYMTSRIAKDLSIGWNKLLPMDTFSERILFVSQNT
jgi:hypothetical protein